MSVFNNLAPTINYSQFIRKTDFISDEIRLNQYLLNKSEESLHVRPVYNASETVRVNFGVALIQVYGLVSYHRKISEDFRDLTYELKICF